MNKEERDSRILKDINEQPALQSLLYDVNLLPEQLKRGSSEWGYMIMIVAAFRVGQKSITDKQ